MLPIFQQQGRTVERVIGDGNCLFGSLSLQLTGNQDLELRKTITKFQQSNIEVFQKLNSTINRTPFPIIIVQRVCDHDQLVMMDSD